MIRFSFRSTDLLLVTQGRALIGEEMLTRDKALSSFPKSNRCFNSQTLTEGTLIVIINNITFR